MKQPGISCFIYSHSISHTSVMLVFARSLTRQEGALISSGPKMYYWINIPPAQVGRRHTTLPFRLARRSLCKTIWLVRVEIRGSPTFLAKGPKFLSFRVSFLRTQPLAAGKLQIYGSHQKSLGKANESLKLTLPRYWQLQEHETHSAFPSSVPNSVLLRDILSGHFCTGHPTSSEDAVSGWAATTAIYWCYKSGCDFSKLPFLMQMYLAMKEKEGRKGPRTQGAAALFQKSFSVFSKRRQQLFKLKLLDKKF